MNSEDIAAIEAACIRLQQRYGTLADRQDPAFRELFTPDAVITLPDLPPFAGLEAILAGQAQWKASGAVMRHLCTNFTVEVESRDRATGLCYLTSFRADPPAGERPPYAWAAPAIGEYHDVFTRVGGRWLFKSRTLSWVFRS